jgi:pimeloyl-ACP methyl ester carboxylesterase
MVDLLSVRAADVGGSVTSQVSPPNFHPASSLLIVLVHGYNVNKRGAEASYSAFAGLLRKYGITTLSTYGQILGFCWPGDVNLGIFSGLAYPTKMSVVGESAALLADFLTKLRGPQGLPIQVIVVAHSLGNRLALQMIGSLLQHSNEWGRTEGLCLMAGAVQVGMVGDMNRLGAAAHASRTRVLFSKDDTVLHWAFPPGETAALEGFFPQAVGLFGNPLTAWTSRFDLQPYNHGDYFYGKANDDRSARYVAQFLGAAVPTELSRSQPSSHSLPAPNVIAARQIGGAGI